MSNVSIVTVTQYKRIKFLELLFKSVSNAIFFSENNVIEWVFIDGSSTPTQTELLRKKIKHLEKQYKVCPVKFYSEKDTPKTIGYLRELSNRKVSSEADYIVVQDDDDYMCPQRIYETVKLFKENPDCDLVGCGNHLMYDYDTDMILTFDKKLHPEHHSVNCVYAYTKKYSQENHYDVDKTFGEEGSFTDDFKNKMYHLNPLYCIVQMSFASNTYNKFMVKAQALSMNQYGVNTLCVVPNPLPPLEYIMSKERVDEYKRLFHDEFEKIRDKKEYDITYYCGFNSIDWDPRDLLKLGGSESAVVHLANSWAKRGKAVQVFLKCDKLEYVPSLIYKGVTYKHANKFSFKDTYNNLILWRVSGLLLLNQYAKINAKKVFVDLHDHNKEQYNIAYEKYLTKIDKVFYKSQFHKELPKLEYKIDTESNAVIIPNGCEYNLFNYDKTPKDEFRFQYSSSYFRGLKDILQWMWPEIVQRIPKATLHLYYGFNDTDPKEQREEIETLIKNSKNVYDHGRVSRLILSEEKKKASYHLYPTLTTSEICCISLKESLLAENILILSDKNIFSTFPGLQMKYTDGMPMDAYYTLAGIKTAEDLLNPDNEEAIKNIRVNGKKIEQIKRWEDVADLWLNYM